MTIGPDELRANAVAGRSYLRLFAARDAPLGRPLYQRHRGARRRSPDDGVSVAELVSGRSPGSTDSISVPCPGDATSRDQAGRRGHSIHCLGVVAENKWAVAVGSVAPAVGGVIPAPSSLGTLSLNDTGEMT
jgi:hypothetical protein